MKPTINTLIVGAICFTLGYGLAFLHSVGAGVDVPSESHAEMANRGQFEKARSHDLNNLSELGWQASTERKSVTLAVEPQDSIHLVKKENNKQHLIDGDSPFASEELNSLTDMLDYMEALAQSGASGKHRAEHFDRLKQHLQNHPEASVSLVSELHRYSTEDEAFNTLLSLIHTLPQDKASQTLASIAEQYTGTLGDEHSRKAFMAVVSSSSQPIQSSLVTQSLVDVALAHGLPEEEKVQALSLIQPGQLFESDRVALQVELDQLVRNGGEQAGARSVPELMRFSDRKQRATLAGELLSQNAINTPVKIALLESIGSGIIPATEMLEEQLMQLANGRDDQVRKEAKDILQHVFEIQGVHSYSASHYAY